MYVKTLARDSTGTLWAGVVRTGKGYGLLRFDHGAWTSYESPEIDGKNMKVQSLLSDRQGSLWIGTSDKGLYRIANGRLDHFDTTTGLSANTVSQIFEDREGGLWVVTPEGVDHFWDLAVLTSDPGRASRQTTWTPWSQMEMGPYGRAAWEHWMFLTMGTFAVLGMATGCRPIWSRTSSAIRITGSGSPGEDSFVITKGIVFIPSP